MKTEKINWITYEEILSDYTMGDQQPSLEQRKVQRLFRGGSRAEAQSAVYPNGVKI